MSFVRKVASITAPPRTITLPGRDIGIFREEFSEAYGMTTLLAPSEYSSRLMSCRASSRRTSRSIVPRSARSLGGSARGRPNASCSRGQFDSRVLRRLPSKSECSALSTRGVDAVLGVNLGEGPEPQDCIRHDAL